jgi:hypothetical protein
LRGKTLRAALVFFVLFGFVVGCAMVDVTKTAKGFYDPTDPNEVEILLTGPGKPYTELGTLTVTGYKSTETAEMHNAVRAKAAPLGANAVILTSQGIHPNNKLWAQGVAIRYKTGEAQK